MLAFLKSTKFKVVIGAIAFLVLLTLYSYFVADWVTTKITDAQMTEVDGKFMIATEARPFVNADAKFRLKFDSANVQNDAVRLKGRTVRIKKYGWRVPMFSMFENVVKIEEVK